MLKLLLTRADMKYWNGSLLQGCKGKCITFVINRKYPASLTAKSVYHTQDKCSLTGFSEMIY